jgi:hypothetical protein
MNMSYDMHERLMIVDRYHGEPIYLSQTEGEPDCYCWDGEEDTYSTDEEVRDAIRRAERSEATWWSIKPGEFR